MMKVAISTDHDHDHAVEAIEHRGGLAITRAMRPRLGTDKCNGFFRNKYTLTHIASGRCLGSKRLKLRDARKALAKLQGLDNWRLSFAKLTRKKKLAARCNEIMSSLEWA